MQAGEIPGITQPQVSLLTRNRSRDFSVERLMGTSAQFWLNLQNLYELRRAEEKVGIAIKRLPTLERREQGALTGSKVHN